MQMSAASVLLVPSVRRNPSQRPIVQQARTTQLTAKKNVKFVNKDTIALKDQRHTKAIRVQKGTTAPPELVRALHFHVRLVRLAT